VTDVDEQLAACHYTRYSDDRRLAETDAAARAAKRRLWADREPVPPWEWRASERDRKAAKRESAGR
jgi:micrococcal nuclease